MKLNELRDNEGATHSRKRLGRGIGSGTGKTGGRGVKGQKARSGVAINGFEGGQSFVTVSLAKIQAAIDAKKLDGKATIDAAALIKAGVIRRAKDGVRVLSDGDLKAKVSLDVAGVSKPALEKIEKAGGSVKLPEAKSE